MTARKINDKFRRPLATEDPSNTGERKVHLQSNTDVEIYIRKFFDLAKNFAPQSEEEHDLHNHVLDSICAIFGKYLQSLQDFPLNVAT